MKKLIYVLGLVSLFAACESGKGTNAGSSTGGTTLPLTSLVDSASYAYGLSVAQFIKSTEDSGEAMTLNLDILEMGMREGVSDAGKLTEEDIRPLMVRYQNTLNKALAEANTAKGVKFLADNAKKKGVITTASGLQYQVITEGTGPIPTANNKVQVNYEGQLLDGTIFDSSYQRGTPAEFQVTGVIAGWTEALQLMKTGAKYKLFIPSDLAYGERGNQGIAPNSMLIFDVELLKILE